MDFKDVYRMYYPEVYYYLLSLCGDPDAAQELTQETFFRALRSIHRFRGECRLKSWLCQIGKNTYLSWLKKGRYLARPEDAQALADRPAASEPGGVEERYLRKEEAQSVYRALHRLREPYKEVFVLRTLGELSYREIGEIFGRGEGWARVTWHRAKLKIQSMLQEEEP